MATRDFLVELGTEELPPKALKRLSQAFADGIEQGLAEANLKGSKIELFAAPRRLAVRISDLPEKQEDKDEVVYGPPANIGFDENGNPTKAAEGFAKRSGADVSEIKTGDNGKLMIELSIKGQETTALLPAIVQTSLDKLPIPKRMRWGASRTEFVRPVHWLVMLFGNDIIDGEVLGLKAGNTSRGHRFHAPEEIHIESPTTYEEALRGAYVMASFEERQQLIKEQVTAEGKKLGGEAVIDEDLLDEVTALNEWPVALAGNFEERFLDVPSEALVSSMKEHQKYFHVVDANGKLKPNFITIANIESKDPAQVIAGNEKVIRPRLADAAFFWDTDRKQSLESRFDKLKSVVWVHKLGSIADKSTRIASLASKIASATGSDTALAERAAKLCKTDLVTQMVYEFTDLQGLAGQYYAQNDGEHADVCAAMVEQYMPAFAGDQLPATDTGTAIALADRLDSLVGLFGLGQIPTGTKDPFALRRASLGVLRILVEKKIDLDLGELIDWAIDNEWPVALKENTKATLVEYMLDRFSAWYQDENIPAEVFQAVRARGITKPLDINNRVHAVFAFYKLDAAQALAAANKRVSNILAKAEQAIPLTVDNALLREETEKQLAEKVASVSSTLAPVFAESNYEQAMQTLAELREPVDQFFDQVMVMAEDEAVRNNRLALLSQLRNLFLEVADISLLQA
ncbi:glycine--tRNA ligase subunit beta [Litoribrevibacter albus]|uniref:Glycine--tRNA ligase beta subunit n=1 Tax=Litoribrevibacter albus TaxID=1473156 RepID=A0AA37SEH9_9GAMM|nr:glycine--tRNA ligase subunit beta [Litoribrevibacter albus]GLQ32927.1 glycine--tRNA ligase beta subunit [Litoribrevibacter albus]